MTYKSIILFLALIYGVSIIGFLFPKLKTGIIPRKTKGLLGIMTATLFHHNWKHLLSNTLPLAVLLFTLQYFYASQTLYVVAIIIFIGGFLLWLFGRKANHIGASGMIYGLTAFIISTGFVYFKPIPLLVSAITMLVYGGLIFGIFPSNKKNTSWEGHLLYTLTGIFTAYFCKNAYYIIH